MNIIKNIIFTIVAVFSISNIALAQTQRFKVGEYMVYDVIAEVKTLGIKGKVGLLETRVLAISNIRGVPTYHIYAHVYNTGIYKGVYIVDDVFQIWVDTNTFMPMQISKRVHEGDWQNNEISIFHPDRGYYLYYDKRTDGDRIDTTGLNLDILGIIYYMRFVDKTQTSFQVNWIEGANVSPNILFNITSGPSIKSVLSRNNIPTKRIKETGKYQTDAIIATGYNQVPLDVIVSEFKVAGLTIRIRGVLKSYRDGK